MPKADIGSARHNVGVSGNRQAIPFGADQNLVPLSLNEICVEQNETGLHCTALSCILVVLVHCTAFSAIQFADLLLTYCISYRSSVQ